MTKSVRKETSLAALALLVAIAIPSPLTERPGTCFVCHRDTNCRYQAWVIWANRLTAGWFKSDLITPEVHWECLDDIEELPPSAY